MAAGKKTDHPTTLFDPLQGCNFITTTEAITIQMTLGELSRLNDNHTACDKITFTCPPQKTPLSKSDSDAIHCEVLFQMSVTSMIRSKNTIYSHLSVCRPAETVPEGGTPATPDTLWRRYSEFELLRTYLLVTYPYIIIPPLPEKRVSDTYN